MARAPRGPRPGSPGREPTPLARWTSNGRTVAAQKVGEFTDRTVGVMSDVRESVTTGVGIDQPIPTDMPIVAEDTVYETWPEGTRVPTV